MKHIFTSLLVCLTTANPLHADPMQQAMQSVLEDNIMNWANDPLIISAVQAQNVETAAYDAAKIDELDRLWRGFIGNTDAEIITAVLQNATADFLRMQVAQSNGAITEVFIMDARGLNVAASQATSDLWQGDEAKFQDTFLIGPTAVHYSDIELDDSTQTVQGQVSMTLVDQDTGAPVGAITVGINITALM